MRNQQSEDSFVQSGNGINWLVLICHSLAATCELFLHKRFGKRYAGIQVFIGALVILFYSGLWPGEDPRPMLWFLSAYLLACFSVRIGTVLKGRRGHGAHSRYSGWPRIMWLLPWVSESVVKRFIEPLLVFSVGVALLSVNKPIGSYLIFAALALFASTNSAEAYERARIQDLQDQVIEQRNIGERFRHSNGNEW